MWTIDSWYNESRDAARANADQVRRMSDHLLSGLGKSLNCSADETARVLRESNQKRLNAVPDTRKYPELRGMKELVAAGWRGLKDGAGLTDAQQAAYCDMNFFFHRNISTLKVGKIGCSYVYFPTSDHGPILANNLDSSPSEPFGPPTWIAVSEHLILGGVSSGVFLDEESPEIFPAPVYKIAARYARTTDEAVELLKRYNHFWGPGNLIVIDRNHGVAMVEKSSCRIGVRKSPDGFGFITAMTAEDPGMNAWLADRRAASVKARNLPAECADTVYWRLQDKRRALMNELLDEARKAPTLEKLRQIIQFRSKERGNVCGNGENYFPGGPDSEHTIRTTIYLLREGRAMWWAKEGDKPSFENRKPDVSFKDVWLWD